MNTRFNDARLSVEKAREALRNGNRTEARQWAEHAASLAPQMEDPWLILAAVASPSASVKYIQTALKINPNSRRARKGMEWAMQRLRENPEPPPLLSPHFLRKWGETKGGRRARSEPGGTRKQTSNKTQSIGSHSAIWTGLHHPMRCGGMVGPFIASAGFPYEQFCAHCNASSGLGASRDSKANVYASIICRSQATPTPQLLLQPTIELTETSAALPTETPIPPQNTEPPTETPGLPLLNTELPIDLSVPSQQNTESRFCPCRLLLVRFQCPLCLIRRQAEAQQMFRFRRLNQRQKQKSRHKWQAMANVGSM